MPSFNHKIKFPCHYIFFSFTYILLVVLVLEEMFCKALVDYIEARVYCSIDLTILLVMPFATYY